MGQEDEEDKDVAEAFFEGARRGRVAAVLAWNKYMRAEQAPQKVGGEGVCIATGKPSAHREKSASSQSSINSTNIVLICIRSRSGLLIDETTSTLFTCAYTSGFAVSLSYITVVIRVLSLHSLDPGIICGRSHEVTEFECQS